MSTHPATTPRRRLRTTKSFTLLFRAAVLPGGVHGVGPAWYAARIVRQVDVTPPYKSEFQPAEPACTPHKVSLLNFRNLRDPIA